MKFQLLTYPVIVAQFFVDGLSRGLMYGLMGMGLALVFGIMGLINFAHGTFFMIGTYLMYMVASYFGLPFPFGILFAALALFAFGVLVELGLISPLRRRLGANWLADGYVMTIGLLIVLENLALIIMGPREHGSATLIPGRNLIMRVVVTNQQIMILVVAVAAVSGLAAFMRFTNLGRAIRATAEHPEAALAMGIDIRRIYTITFGLSAALIGGVGAMLIATYPAFPTIGSDVLLKSFIVVIVGGLGNVWAAMIAGPLLGLIEAYAQGIASAGWQNSIIAALVIAVLVFRPSGLFSKPVTRP
jgi:branched-chain amino acid transport system permease protein